MNMSGIGGAGTVDTTGGSISLSGNLGGPGGLTMIGTGNLTLSGMNALGGNLIVDGGTLQVPGGELAASNQYIGYSGTGSFTQSGGTNSVSGTLYVGNNAGSSGSYALSGSGLLAAPAENIGVLSARERKAAPSSRRAERIPRQPSTWAPTAVSAAAAMRSAAAACWRRATRALPAGTPSSSKAAGPTRPRPSLWAAPAGPTAAATCSAADCCRSTVGWTRPPVPSTAAAAQPKSWPAPARSSTSPGAS